MRDRDAEDAALGFDPTVGVFRCLECGTPLGWFGPYLMPCTSCGVEPAPAVEAAAVRRTEFASAVGSDYSVSAPQRSVRRVSVGVLADSCS